MQVEAYLFFEGRCEEALNFYREALGAEITAMMPYSESPEPGSAPPNSADKIMHATFRVGDTTVMASDGMCSGKTTFSGFSLTLMPQTDAEAVHLFNALSVGGHVQMPLTPTFFASTFGMVADRFGVSWMIYVAPAGM